MDQTFNHAHFFMHYNNVLVKASVYESIKRRRTQVKLKSHSTRRDAVHHDADLIWFESHD